MQKLCLIQKKINRAKESGLIVSSIVLRETDSTTRMKRILLAPWRGGHDTTVRKIVGPLGTKEELHWQFSLFLWVFIK